MFRLSRLMPAICLPLLLAACATHPDNPSFAVTVEAADAAIKQMRADPKPLERPLLIIGGFWDPNFSPPLFRNHFKKSAGDDHMMVTVSIGFCGSFAECRRKVIEAIESKFPSSDPNWTSEVDVIGASLGGLTARYAAAPSEDPNAPRRLKIKRLFSIASPHSGATLAKLFALTAFHRDMRPESPFLKKLAEHDHDARYEIYPYVWLGDGIVGPQYAAPPGMNPLWLPALPLHPTHGGAMIDSRILADIGRRLRGEEGFAKIPGAPLPGAGNLKHVPRRLLRSRIRFRRTRRGNGV
jgi:hypothetical protein